MSFSETGPVRPADSALTGVSDSPQRDGNGAAGDEQWRGAQQKEEEEEEQGGSQHELLVDELD